MNQNITSPVSTPGSTPHPSVRGTLGRSSKRRNVLATLGAAAGLAVLTTAFAGVGEAQAADFSATKVKAMQAVTAQPGAIRTPSGKLRCTKPGQYHVKVNVPVTTKGRNSIRSGALWLQPTFRGDPVLIGRAKAKSSVVPVIGCFSPSQVQGLKRGPAYLIAVDVTDGHRNVVRVRLGR